MEEDVVQKLSTYFTKEVLKQESDVLHVMVLIRKLLEMHDSKAEFTILNFYANWCLHSQIDNTTAIAKDIKDVKFGDTQKLTHLLHLGALRNDMVSFAKYHNIDTNIEESNYWDKFRCFLVDILCDIPLVNPTSNISKIILKKASEDSFDDAEYSYVNYAANMEVEFVTGGHSTFHFFNPRPK